MKSCGIFSNFEFKYCCFFISDLEFGIFGCYFIFTFSDKSATKKKE